VIERNWNELIRPEKPLIETGADANRKARLVAEPLERGFGVGTADCCGWENGLHFVGTMGFSG